MLKQSGLNSTVESHNVAIGTLVVDVVATVLIVLHCIWIWACARMWTVVKQKLINV